ncbi:murein biosynthesis integral membrane protein MurJ [Latilactobacillus graminis]|uniref:Uncharacterized protein n=2 Tax=Latilactobacillus graminis TaxID=60519 RepID=A0AA89I0Q5_9LACO|nr:lipid II flippase MurJ [Latilactobacillus graminis]KRM21198.1 hypothetical protein FC90_GL001735 [Latilactobacillus graminis DSM 20719]QFP79324.1 oligosaccharide flippase family protein [Latilactobacillus graminis]
MKGNLVKIFGIVTVLTLLNQTLTLVRASIMATQFGVSNQMDAFNMANTLMVCLINVLGASVATVFVPFLTQMQDNAEDRLIFNSYISVMSTVVGVILSGYLIVGNLYFKFSSSQSLFATMMFSISLVLALGQYVRLLTSIETAIFQTENRFGVIKVGAILATVSSLIALELAHHYLTIRLAAAMITLSYWIEWGYLSTRKKAAKFHFKWHFAIHHRGVKELLNLTGPVVLNSFIYQISLLIPTVIIRFFGTGFVSINSYANQILNIMQTLILTNILTMLYPELARTMQNDRQAGQEKLIFFIILTNTIVIPITFGAIVVGPLLIQILFQRGNFTASATNAVWQFLCFGSLSLPLVVIREFIYRAFYSLQDTKTPVKNSLLTISLQMIYVIAGAKVFGIVAVMSAPLVAAGFSVSLGLWQIKRVLPQMDAHKLMIKHSLISFLNGGIMMIVVKKCTGWLTLPPLLRLISLVIIGALLYGGLTLSCQGRYFWQYFREGKVE